MISNALDALRNTKNILGNANVYMRIMIVTYIIIYYGRVLFVV